MIFCQNISIIMLNDSFLNQFSRKLNTKVRCFPATDLLHRKINKHLVQCVSWHLDTNSLAADEHFNLSCGDVNFYIFSSFSMVRRLITKKGIRHLDHSVVVNTKLIPTFVQCLVDFLIKMPSHVPDNRQNQATFAILKTTNDYSSLIRWAIESTQLLE